MNLVVVIYDRLRILCFRNDNIILMKDSQLDFLTQLEAIIDDRLKENSENSYTATLAKKGYDKVLQKVGEEAIEYLIDAKNRDTERMIYESADFIFHLLISLRMNGLSIVDTVLELEKRHK